MSVERICYSVLEAAAATGYSETRIRKSIREGHLKAGRPGGKGDYRILTEDLKSWLRGEGEVTKDRPPGPAAIR